MSTRHPNLLAEYRLDGNANDTGGAGLTGTPSNVSYASGLGSSVGVFNGATSIVNCGAAFTVTDKLTITAWVKAADAGGLFPRIAGADGKWIILIDRNNFPGQMRWFGSGVDTVFAGSSNTLFNGAWHHVAATYAGNGITGYVNGVEIGTLAKTGNLDALAGVPVSIGNRVDLDRGLSGSIARVRIYDAALSPSDIKRDMTGFLPLRRS